MFVAIVVPETRKHKATAACVLVSVLLSCVFRYTPVLNKISAGFVIIICAVAASALFAAVAPIPSENDDN